MAAPGPWPLGHLGNKISHILHCPRVRVRIRVHRPSEYELQVRFAWLHLLRLVVRVRNLSLFDQDEAAMSEVEGAEETEREQEKLGLQGGRKARPLRRCWRGRRGGAAGTGGAAKVVEAGVLWCVQCAQ